MGISQGLFHWASSCPFNGNLEASNRYWLCGGRGLHWLQESLRLRRSGIMLNKLRYQFGILGSLLNWLTSYLTSRSQYMVLNGQRSNLCSVSSVVPQGSVMGPTLFTLYTSDLVASIQSGTVYMYAFDTTIYCIGKTIKRSVGCVKSIPKRVVCLVREE